MSGGPLVAGVAYRRDWRELRRWFVDESSCVEYLERLRWPDGPRCRRCGLFERSKLPLETWFAAAWYVTNQKGGVSSLGLQRALGLGSYRTAWTLTHKLRRAMIAPDRAPLERLVEVDETYLGAPTRGGKRGRGAIKTPVMIGVELSDNYKPQRVRLERLERVDGAAALAFAHRTIAAGATIRTDAASIYPILTSHGYQHWPVTVAQTGDDAHVAMPAVHRVASLLKR